MISGRSWSDLRYNSRQLPGGTEETHKTSVTMCLWAEIEAGTSEYEAETLNHSDTTFGRCVLLEDIPTSQNEQNNENCHDSRCSDRNRN
jgi:hypothetical protein